MNTQGTQFLAATLMAAAAAFSTPAVAEVDVVVLKDGTRVEGEIIREVSGAVFIRVGDGGVSEQKFFMADQIESVLRGVAAAARPDGNFVDAGGEGQVFDEDTPRGIVVTLEGMVGVSMSADRLEEMVPALTKAVGDDGTGIVVLKINSGGGYLYELDRISDIIQYQYKPRFHTVAWIESAISAAAMTAHNLEEIYFLPEGNYGACTGYSGMLNAMDGRGWEEAEFLMQKISARGDHDHKVMLSMMGHPQRFFPLSARRNPESGQVEWAQDAGVDGWTVLNPVGEVLTFNSVQAVEWEFADGIARDTDELAELMGYQEVNWLGERETGTRYPVSAIERQNRQWRERIAEDESKADVTRGLYYFYKGNAAGMSEDIRGVFVGKARSKLKILKRLFDMNSTMALSISNTLPEYFDDWYEQELEDLRDIGRAGR